MPSGSRTSAERSHTLNLTDAERAIQELRDAVAAGRPEAIAHAAMSNIWPLYNAHFDELTAAVESLPGPLLMNYPILRILHRMTPVLARTTTPFKPLVSPADARNMSAEEIDILTLVQMVAFRLSGDVAAAMIHARRLQERILDDRGRAREQLDGPLWFYHQQIGTTLLTAGESSAALLEFTTARELGTFSGQPDAERMILGRTALAHAVRGSLDEAERALEAISALPSPAAAHRASTTMTERSARALIDVERMAPDVDALLPQLETYDSIEPTWPFALLARTRHLLARQQADEALEVVRLASDAHPDQHGSFASDVIKSISVEALWSLGDRRAARRIGESSGRSGHLTRLAMVRLELLESHLEEAAHGLRGLAGDRSLGPGPHAERNLLSAWLECALTDTIGPATALQVSRLASRTGTRRLFSTMPLQLIRQVQKHLSASDAAAFGVVTEGLAAVDRPRPPALTSSEIRVLHALPHHQTTAEIAVSLFVSPNTVKSQLRSLYRKLDCSNREDAIVAASRLHLLADDARQRP